MNSFQKVIKYAAMAFAIILTVIILTGIVGAASSLVSVFGGEEEDRIDYNMDFSDVEKLDISHKIGDLRIKLGSGFRVEAANVSKDFRAELKNGTLKVGEPDSFNVFPWFISGKLHKKIVITVYVPEDFNAKMIKVDGGAGEVVLEDLSTDYLIIDAGVGDLYGRNLHAKKVEVDAGVGNLELRDVVLSDVYFDCGVGNISIEGIINGKSEFDCGIGNVDLKLEGEREDYALDIDSGIGNIRINGRKVAIDYYDNNKADNTITIDGGVGDLEIEFAY